LKVPTHEKEKKTIKRKRWKRASKTTRKNNKNIYIRKRKKKMNKEKNLKK